MLPLNEAAIEELRRTTEEEKALWMSPSTTTRPDFSLLISKISLYTRGLSRRAR